MKEATQCRGCGRTGRGGRMASVLVLVSLLIGATPCYPAGTPARPDSAGQAIAGLEVPMPIPRLPHVPAGKMPKTGQTTAGTTTYGGGPAILPDLDIVDVMIIPTAPTGKDRIDCVVTVINTGGAYDYENTDITARLTITGPLGSEPEIVRTSKKAAKPVSQGGQAVKLFFRDIALPKGGSYTNTVAVKLKGPTREIVTDNNKKTITYTVKKLPDLQVWISRPSDVRVSGPKRWFQMMVRNTGYAASPASKAVLHIDGDGTHTYSVPPLAPRETYPADRRIKRGIKWRTKGRKRYSVIVDPDNKVLERNERNNRIRDSLKVYLPKPWFVFNPTATVITGDSLYFKKHGVLTVGRKEHIVFAVYNDSGRQLSRKASVDITLRRQDDSGRSLLIFHDTYSIEPLFPGEKRYIDITRTFQDAGTYLYTATMAVYYDRKYHHWKSNDISGSFHVEPEVGEAPVGP